MSWTAYLAPLNGFAPDSAIISLQGAHCGHVGKWDSSQAEEMNYANLFKDLSSAQVKGLQYGGKKYIIIRAGDDVLIAQSGKEGIVMQKSGTVIVAAHFGEGSVAGSVASRIDLIVRQLVQNGC
ncbi:Profilin A [Tritrichomonas foetus]|uniref:Profilin n=1 Tax=Tritrichomonas foetus TaxID=1144522 RepID=A0A1J4K3Q5_9EUKA|nr:Profilin A [Tritrichomonas foetus]|eukprot:OHT04358.1 Profilin A [Tritrichomonas foetus]